MSIRFISFLFLFVVTRVNAQTAQWWENNVQWDGSSHWSRYLVVSPKYFGPNALTIPSMNNGCIDSISSLGFSGQFYFSKGDNTRNLVLYGNYAPKNTRISVDVQFIPYEYYRMSHEIKTERKIFYQAYNDKQCAGDVLASTTVQLFPSKQKKFQAALRLGLRMPSGGDLAAARYADVPGYWIDGGLAIPFHNRNWKWINMAGFYVWQTNDDKHRQNDAILFGTGFEYNLNSWKAQAVITGYSGYKNNGDRPLVVRAGLEQRSSKKIYFLRFQQGLHDYNYFSIESGMKFIFRK